MTIEQAHLELDRIYKRAEKSSYVKHPVAYSLHQVWKKADDDDTIQDLSVLNAKEKPNDDNG